LFADGIVVTLLLTVEHARPMKQLRTHYDDIVSDLPPSYDRRFRERVALKIPLRVLSYGPLAEKSSEAICIDLSEGGVSFESTAELPVGDIVILEFQLRGEPAYRCHVRLTYRMARRYGGYFLGGQ
jgi:PilZ domain